MAPRCQRRKDLGRRRQWRKATSQLAVVGIATAPLERHNVTSGPNDAIWILGYQLTAERKLLSAPPHAILRQFDGQGNRVAEHLPWPAINGGGHPLLETAHLTASPTKIGILLKGCQSWIELSPTGQPLGCWPVTLPTGFTPQRMHLENPMRTNSGVVYFFASTPDVTDAAGYLRHTALFSLAGVDADSLDFCS